MAPKLVKSRPKTFGGPASTGGNGSGVSGLTSASSLSYRDRLRNPYYCVAPANAGQPLVEEDSAKCPIGEKFCPGSKVEADGKPQRDHGEF